MSTTMTLGLALPQLGSLADPAAVRAVATAAEEQRFSSLWVIDRLLAPVVPRSPYPGTIDGTLPAMQRRSYDPLVTLTVAAAVTERIGLGTDVLVAPWYPPVLLARTLATLDAFSGGRLTVGFGLGWSIDEYEAAGVPFSGRGARLEEVLDVIGASWRDDVVAITTSRERVVPSHIDAKPVRDGGPPVLLAAFTPAGLARVARRADGWIPAGMPLDVVATMWAGVRHMATGHGRDPDSLRLVLRTEPHLTSSAQPVGRMPFTGTFDQISGDIERARDIGVTELIVDLHHCARTADEVIDLAGALTAGVTAMA